MSHQLMRDDVRPEVVIDRLRKEVEECLANHEHRDHAIVNDVIAIPAKRPSGRQTPEASSQSAMKIRATPDRSQ